jgi:adenosylmethionine-8-amino-7-oxononanoate aminotransferase
VFEAFSGAYSEYRTLFHGHTYGGNPLGCAAAIANLEVFEHQGTLATANERGQLFGRLLDEHIVPLAHAGPPRRVGMMAAFDILRDTDTGQAFGTDERRGNRAVLEARKDGVIIRPLGDTMVLMPPLNIPPELLGRIVETTATAVARATSD